jgi:CheY-like chemotaxis protein
MPRGTLGEVRMARVLVADDEPGIRLLLGRLLRGDGHDVLEAADGDAALESILLNHPEVAILDVMMPGLTGLDVCRLVRADPGVSRTPLLVLSANGEEGEALRAGADAFLGKPFLPSRLLDAVGNLVAN